MLREPQEEEEVRSGLCNDLYCLEDGKFQCLAFLTELREKYGCDGIQ